MNRDLWVHDPNLLRRRSRGGLEFRAEVDGVDGWDEKVRSVSRSELAEVTTAPALHGVVVKKGAGEVTTQFDGLGGPARPKANGR